MPIAHVVPAVKLPRDTSHFDYLTDDPEIGRGSVVFVPWRRRQIPGVVLGIADSSEVPVSRLKPIAGRAANAKLSEDWLVTLEWAASRYLAAPGTIAKCFLPSWPKRFKLEALPSASTTGGRSLPLGQTGRVRLYSDSEDRQLAVRERVEAALDAGQTAIILAPHHADIAVLENQLAPFVGEDRLVAVHGGLAAGQLHRNWQACLHGTARVVIGSRLAAMAPVPNLGLIMVVESDSLEHKQVDQNPRYDARALAFKRSATSGAELLLATPAPRVEEMLAVSQGLALEDAALAPAEVVLADTSSRSPDWSGALAPVTLDRLAEALQNGRNALIYHNRRGTAGALICHDCGHVFRCRQCGLALAVHGDELHCHRCDLQSSTPLQCPECHGASLRPIGWGSAAIAADLKKRFPEASIVRFEKDTERLGNWPEPPTIMIGGRQLLHDLVELQTGPLGAVIATSAEDLLRSSGFRAKEEAWGQVRRLRYLAAYGNCPLVLQTLTTDDPAVRSLAREPKPFLMDELAERQQAGYPPFGRLVLILCRGKTELAAQQAAFHAKRELAPAIRHNGPTTRISDPYPAKRPVSYGQWRQLLAIRAPLLGPELVAALKRLPDNYVIETDPESPL
jgi:primosomal protein N' (replication factor Y)